MLAIDGTNLLYRTYHALAGTDRADERYPHWVLDGLLATLGKQVALHRPSSLVVALDGSGGCPWRLEHAPEYKAGRASTPEYLVSELRAAGDILGQLGIAWRTGGEWEADDVLATLATRASEMGARAVVVTSDKDAHQLVGEAVMVYKPEGIIVTDEMLSTKYGVTGARWVEYAALIGEQSDNLPGVVGIGPKRAAQIVNAFADVDEAFAGDGRASAVLGERIAGMLAAGEGAYRRNRLVATLRRDLDIDLGSLRINAGSAARVRETAGALGVERGGRSLANALAGLGER